MQGPGSHTTTPGLKAFFEDALHSTALSISKLQAQASEVLDVHSPQHGPAPPWIATSTQDLFGLVDSHVQSTITSTDPSIQHTPAPPIQTSCGGNSASANGPLCDYLVSQLLQILEMAGASPTPKTTASAGVATAAAHRHDPHRKTSSVALAESFTEEPPAIQKDASPASGQHLPLQDKPQALLPPNKLAPAAYASALDALLSARSATQHQQPTATAPSHYSTLVPSAKNVRSFAEGPDVMRNQQRQQSMEEMKVQEEAARMARKKRTFLQYDDADLDVPLSQRRVEAPAPSQPNEHIVHTRPRQAKPLTVVRLLSPAAAAAAAAVTVAAAAAKAAAEATLMDFGPSMGFQRTAPSQVRAAHKLSMEQRASSPPLIDLTEVVDMLGDDDSDDEIPQTAPQVPHSPSTHPSFLSKAVPEQAEAPQAPPPTATVDPLHAAPAAAATADTLIFNKLHTVLHQQPLTHRTSEKGAAAPSVAAPGAASVLAPACAPLMRGAAGAPTRMNSRLGKMGELGLSAVSSALPTHTKPFSALPAGLRGSPFFSWTAKPSPPLTKAPVVAVPSQPAGKEAPQLKKQHYVPSTDAHTSPSQSHSSPHKAAGPPAAGLAAVLAAAAAVAAGQAAVAAAAAATAAAHTPQEDGSTAPPRESSLPHHTPGLTETLDVEMEDQPAGQQQSHHSALHDDTLLSDPLGGSEDTQSCSAIDSKHKDDLDSEVKTAPAKRRFKPTPGVRRGAAPCGADHAGPSEFASAAADGGAAGSWMPESAGPAPHSTAGEGSGAAGEGIPNGAPEGVTGGARDIPCSMEQEEWDKRHQVISAQRAEVQAQRVAAKSARETSALLEQLQQKQRSKGASSTQQPASSGTSQLAGSVANKEETWQEVSARKTAARHAETAQRVQARLDSYTAQQSAASSLAASKEETRTRVRMQLEVRHKASLKEVDLRKFLMELKVQVAPMSSLAAKGAAAAASDSLRRSLKTAKIRFHPDKVPVGSSVYDIVRAEEVSKILNAWDMRRV